MNFNADFVRGIMDTLGMSQRELGRRTDISERQIRYILAPGKNKRKDPSNTEALAIMRVLEYAASGRTDYGSYTPVISRVGKMNQLAAHLSGDLPFPLDETIKNIPGEGGDGKEEWLEALAQGIAEATYISPERMNELFAHKVTGGSVRCIEALSQRKELTEWQAAWLIRACLQLYDAPVSVRQIENPQTLYNIANNVLSHDIETGKRQKLDERLEWLCGLLDMPYNVKVRARDVAKRAYEIWHGIKNQFRPQPFNFEREHESGAEKNVKVYRGLLDYADWG